MFFKKNSPHPATAKPLPLPNSSAEAPIYILGTDPLARFLGARLTAAEYRVVFLSATHNTKYTLNVQVKEDHNLNRHKYALPTDFRLRETPLFLLITEPVYRLNAALTTLSPSRLNDSPILCFTPLLSAALPQAIAGHPIINAGFDGFLTQDGETVLLQGRAPSVEIGDDGTESALTLIKKVFENAKLSNLSFLPPERVFWNFFAAYALGALSAGAADTNLFQLLKDKTWRQRLENGARELAALANAEKTPLTTDDIMKKIHAVPLNYQYDLQAEFRRGNPGPLDFIASTITGTARRHGLKTPELRNLLNNLYNIILA